MAESWRLAARYVSIGWIVPFDLKVDLKVEWLNCRPGVTRAGVTLGRERSLESEYLSTGEVAHLLGVSRQTVLRWVRSGALPATETLGGHLRLRVEDVEALRHRLALAAEHDGFRLGPGSNELAPAGRSVAGRRKGLRIYVVVQGRYGRRIVQNVQAHGPACWSVQVFEAPARLPVVVDDPEEFLPVAPPQVDLLLALGEEPGVAELVPDLARLTGCRAVIAPIDRTSWLPPGLRRQVEARLSELGVASVFPKPFCTLTEQSFGYRRAAERYASDPIAEFARHFGQPSLKVVVDPESRAIAQVMVERDAACGCTRYVAEHLIGVSAEEAEQKAGLLHHHYPCLASMQKEQIDEALNDTLMHVSGYVLKAAVEAEVRPFKRPPAYYTPPGKPEL